jgi:hypothetical protein
MLKLSTPISATATGSTQASTKHNTICSASRRDGGEQKQAALSGKKNPLGHTTLK